MEAVARALRGSSKPFGGMQLILCGDFAQLPPVTTGPPSERAVRYAFEANTWRSCVPRCIALTEVFRQQDMAFVEALNELRFGRCNPVRAAFASIPRTRRHPVMRARARSALSSCSPLATVRAWRASRRALSQLSSSRTAPTWTRWAARACFRGRSTAHTRPWEQVNERQLALLPGAAVTHKAVDSIYSKKSPKALNSCVAKESLRLKGARALGCSCLDQPWYG